MFTNNNYYYVLLTSFQTINSLLAYLKQQFDENKANKKTNLLNLMDKSLEYVNQYLRADIACVSVIYQLTDY